ncbi:hypothetical protein TRFO_07814 [Tritrichomonas foetus]|uniref:Bacterial alpha-L-rhamnosidase N-terminal domain-containing protein n=1 Tax=Tritrichomonas foetus TaxID=1144522 RepID=A0A1J4JPY3_9EUKA|nr:hypothetical protein TRFO_07814 [Tritrichomonas foetus]|eukprot:OHT00818.1 hypothetical protein TRFO_07814 [Tritrichomonas foetus]
MMTFFQRLSMHHYGMHARIFLFILFLQFSILLLLGIFAFNKSHQNNSMHHFLFPITKNISFPFIDKMKTNGISNPIGYELGIPSLSWIIRNAPLNSKLVSSRVEISEDESFNKILSDSGPKKDLSSIDYRVNFKLLPRKRYFWRVTAELTNITIKSPSAYFETSKLDEPWQSNWISPKNNKNPPIFRKQFTLKENHENARIYITGLGLYELYINGKRVSNELFTPFCNSYEKWIQYQTFDVTDFIQKGENVIGVIIGDGWAKGRWGFAGTPADMTLKSEERGFPREISTSKYLLNVEMHIKTEDNSEVVIVSDETWKTSKSEILFTNIYDGEVIDSNLIQEGWSNIDFDDSNWESVQIAHHKSKNENSQNYNDNENTVKLPYFHLVCQISFKFL